MSTNSITRRAHHFCLLAISGGMVDAFFVPLPYQRMRCRPGRLHAATDSMENRDPLQQMLYHKELESQQQGWLEPISSFPFECTSCGKCCRTIGNVFMSPEEVTAAADYLNITASAFVTQYAERELGDSSDAEEEVPWILLANQKTSIGPACEFLDIETNHCQIYPVRPIQCSTYPFWTNLMESDFHWNVEVRRSDGDQSSTLPDWTAEEGGCEGMRILSEENTSSETEGVPINNALEQLSLYQRADRRLPRNMLPGENDLE